MIIGIYPIQSSLLRLKHSAVISICPLYAICCWAVGGGSFDNGGARTDSYGSYHVSGDENGLRSHCVFGLLRIGRTGYELGHQGKRKVGIAENEK